MRIILVNSYDTVVVVLVDEVQQEGFHKVGLRRDDGIISGIYYIIMYVDGELTEKRMIILVIED
ncbi:MAG: hypothetical protein JSU64_03020 [candidate division WOR-3 bacterium]|nr:MAG: hypothetical protein JSU64_03020 [candidate division WOR-3 bacterium]UCF06932.1 MAG: hypothetical protein JSV33_07905 [bacterium]